MRRVLFLIFVIFFGFIGVFAQRGTSSKTDKELKSLQKEQKKLSEQIQRTSQNFENARMSTKEAMREVDRLDQDITKRGEVIAAQSRGIDSLNMRADELEKEILRKELDYSSNKVKYVDLIYHAYVKNTAYNKLIFILSAETFQETYRRFRYIQDFASMRRQQAETIENSRKELVAKRNELSQSKKHAQDLLGKREKEQQELIEEKEAQSVLVATLQIKEKELAAELEKQQKNAEILSERIQKVIEDQARIAAEKAAKQKKKTPSNSGKVTEQQSGPDNSEFAACKGKLPMPLSNATITGRFGVHQHPVLKHVTVNNKGIYLTASKGAVAKAIFKGEVTQKFSIPGNNNAVIIRHDNYLTVYSNLTNINVKIGDKLNAGDQIGKVFEDSEDGGRTTLFFQIWKEKELQNPELWLKKNK
ncbi:MAG: peptidoglycan DD-metalloendopeptidase family protein [Paludibacteraceae bacterium]|nr:peptidoglycan DD-metalloendopeptidase family protein [Paludibacteraceae bacterium]